MATFERGEVGWKMNAGGGGGGGEVLLFNASMKGLSPMQVPMRLDERDTARIPRIQERL